MTSALVTTQWLAEHLATPDVKVADATWFMPAAKRDPRAEYTKQHIPGAVFFDIDDISDESNPLPHMLPPAAKFSARVRALGLGDGGQIVVYDNNHFFAAARAWWMFRYFGHAHVAVLDGGLAKWLADGRPVDGDTVHSTPRHFTPRTNGLLLREIDQMRANVTSRREQVVDARSAARFAADEPEPRPGLRSGHIPGSRSLPATDLVAADKTLLAPALLRQRFAAAGIDIAKPVVTTCGSGVSAAVLSLGLYELGQSEAALYDGSWTEWGSQQDTPVATGPA